MIERVPVGPDGGTDLLARPVAKKLSETWGQAVVVENKTGGGGIIGAETVIKSAPDGCTLLLSHDGVITATPLLFKRPDFDPARQLAPISPWATIPYLVVVHPSVPAMTDVIAGHLPLGFFSMETVLKACDCAFAPLNCQRWFRRESLTAPVTRLRRAIPRNSPQASSTPRASR